MKKLLLNPTFSIFTLPFLFFTGLSLIADDAPAEMGIPEITAIQKETTSEGLIIETIKEGSGKTALKGTSVTIHYTGWLDNGKKLDSTRDRDRAYTFPLGEGRVIKGWEMGIEGMKVGEIRRLTVPPELAYGSAGHGNLVPPDATLIFDVEVIDVEKIKVEKIKKAPESPPEITPLKSWEKKDVLIELIKEGTGTAVAENKKTCYVHYTGWLAENGKKFDSSLDRGKPFSFLMGYDGVIKGWEIGIEGMKVGEIRRLTIPPKHAYSEKGAGNSIPPNATLIFDVELVDLIGND